VFRLAEKHYGKIPRPSPAGRKPRLEPLQVGIKRLVVKAPAKLPYLSMAWKVPALRDLNKEREPYALEVLAAVLDGHDGARFARNLVRGKQVAVSAGAGYDATVRGEALFSVVGTPAEGRTVAELEAALRAEIVRVANEGVSAEELERVKTQTIAAQVYKRDSMMAQAMEIGRLEAAGVSLARHRHPARKDPQRDGGRSAGGGEEVLFGDASLTVAVLDPQPLPERQGQRKSQCSLHVRH
jgi:zinc protease